ncbi:MAG: hypothetical protein IIU08_05950 [Clostridia bacterium]|nr:hypothetical protein [Clostridia bacterium]
MKGRQAARTVLFLLALILPLLLFSCRAVKTDAEAGDGGVGEEIDFGFPTEGSKEGREQKPSASSKDMQPHPLFYLNGVWSAVGAYEDDLYYEYDEIDEMSLVFENGWVAFTAKGETRIYPLEQKSDRISFTVPADGEAGESEVVIDYYDNGYYLGLVPASDPSFEILFERQ